MDFARGKAKVSKRKEEDSPASDGDGDGDRLPESCIAHALSFTSPRDACSSALISTTFHRAADSDALWAAFLPPDYLEILWRALHPPPAFSSKKELYFSLCNPILIDGGKMSFELERSSGKKCFMISTRALNMKFADARSGIWRWIPSSGSRFPEAADLNPTCWLDIRGTLALQDLSPKTTYCVYIIFKVSKGRPNVPGFSATSSVTVGPYVSQRRVWLDEPPLTSMQHKEGKVTVQHFSPQVSRPCNMTSMQAPTETFQVARKREDGWFDLEMGEFFTDEAREGEVEIHLFDLGRWKRGITFQGIEVRPRSK